MLFARMTPSAMARPFAYARAPVSSTIARAGMVRNLSTTSTSSRCSVDGPLKQTFRGPLRRGLVNGLPHRTLGRQQQQKLQQQQQQKQNQQQRVVRFAMGSQGQQWHAGVARKNTSMLIPSRFARYPTQQKPSVSTTHNIGSSATSRHLSSTSPSSSPSTPAPSSSSSSSAVASRGMKIWLGGCTAMVFTIVVVGGITRLTESGLSITEWKPLSGALPPRSDAEWEAEFERYKQFPEYQKMNYGMTLTEFKKIFFWEWFHRTLGRTLGVVFVLPFAYFAAKGQLRGKHLRRCSAILVGIGFQGALGWYMVQSGLKEELLRERGDDVPRVSQYRLASHLGAAFTLYAGMLWTFLDITFPKPHAGLTGPRIATLRRFAKGTFGLISVTVLSGALVAGLDAGLIYNSVPFMGTGFVPPEWLDMSPKWRNFLENSATVQFDHRVLALSSCAAVASLWAYGRKSKRMPRRTRLAMNKMFAMVWVQAALGISTLVLLVPTWLGATHQGGALTLFSFSLWFVHELRRVPK